MRTNIEINDKLMKAAKRLIKARTKKQVVNFALENLIKTGKRHDLLKLFGKVRWEGDLKQMRS